MTRNPVSRPTCRVAVTFLSYVSISIWEMLGIKTITAPGRAARRPCSERTRVRSLPRWPQLLIHNVLDVSVLLDTKKKNVVFFLNEKKGSLAINAAAVCFPSTCFFSFLSEEHKIAADRHNFQIISLICRAG